MPLFKKKKKFTRLATRLISSLLSCASLQIKTYHTKGNSITGLAKALAQGVDALPPSKPQPRASACSHLSVWSVNTPSSHGVSKGCIAFKSNSSATALAPRSTPLPQWKGKISVWKVGHRARILRKWDRTATYFQEHTVRCWKHYQEEKLFSLKDC